VYWYPIYAFVRGRGFNPEDAQDLTQGFFLHILEHQILLNVSPLKGKFRSFLLATLQNYLSDAADRARSIKRGGKIEFVSLDKESTEDPFPPGPVDLLTPEKIYNARWANTLLDEAMNQLARRWAVLGKEPVFQALKPFLDPVNIVATDSYEEVAQALQVNAGSVKTMVHRLRKQYSSLLREEVSRTVSDAGEIDEEIHCLCEALIAAEGRLDT
jgi:RNA polymerase sigma-70 factor (ECF subfamily)